jgi:hypothetical protein
MHDRLMDRLRWMETDSKYAHACPDLDQEYPNDDHAEAERVRTVTARMYQAALEQARQIREARSAQRINLWAFGGSGRLEAYLAQLGDA